MNKTKTLLVSAAITAMTVSSYAVSFNTVSGPFTGGSTAIPGGPSVGHRFDVTGPGIWVSSLAFVSSSGSSLNAGTSAQIGIYSYSGPAYTGSFSASPITGASATITSASTVSANYAWETLGAPVYLPAGRYGLLATSVTLGGSDMIGNAFLGDGLPTFTSGFDVVATPLLGDAVGGPLSTPSIDNRRFKIANFEFTPVPEPETYAMIAGLGLVGFGLWRKRQ
jgi:PEP-CTERM motif